MQSGPLRDGGRGLRTLSRRFDPETDERGWRFRPSRVLVAEDDPEFRALLAMALWTDGYHVVEAASGSELLGNLAPYLPDALTNGRMLAFDLIVSDVRLPGLNGPDVISLLRRYDASVPVVLMTAFGDQETHDRARSLRAEIFDKPFDLDLFREFLRTIVPP